MCQKYSKNFSSVEASQSPNLSWYFRKFFVDWRLMRFFPQSRKHPFMLFSKKDRLMLVKYAWNQFPFPWFSQITVNKNLKNVRLILSSETSRYRFTSICSYYTLRSLSSVAYRSLRLTKWSSVIRNFFRTWSITCIKLAIRMCSSRSLPIKEQTDCSNL